MANNPAEWQDFLFKKKNIHVQHFLFWLFVVLVTLLFKEYPTGFQPIEITCYLIQFVAFMAIPGYFHNFLVLPLFKRQKIFLGLLLYIAELLLLTLLLPYLFKGISQAFISLFDIGNWINWENENIAFNIFGFTVMASVINIAKERVTLQKEQKEAELKLLKEQLNPHFLFNTMNNLYGLSVIKSDRLPSLMLKLSDLLRYSLYETNQNAVSLEKELLYINNYIELEKIRLEDRTTIDLKITGNFTRYSIAPLMLIVFIENSFKHHSSKSNEKGNIKIDISMEEGIFKMSVLNSVDPSVIQDEKLKKTGGIGVSNVKKRLHLIYGEKYKLIFDRQPEYYKVYLKINVE